MTEISSINTPIIEKKTSKTIQCSRLFFFFLLFFSTIANAEVLGYLNVSTNYIWRGVTQTSDDPAVSVAIEYHTKQKSYIGLWTSNTKYGGRRSQELNAYLGHKFNLEQAVFDIAVRHYYFPSGGKYNYDFRPDKWQDKESSSFTEFQTSLTLGGLSAGYAYSNNYLDCGDFGSYIEVNYTYEIVDKVSLKIHAGQQKSEAIDDTQNRVSDRSATFKYKDIFCTASTLTDNEDGRQSDEIRYVIGWSMVIGE